MSDESVILGIRIGRFYEKLEARVDWFEEECNKMERVCESKAAEPWHHEELETLNRQKRLLDSVEEDFLSGFVEYLHPPEKAE